MILLSKKTVRLWRNGNLWGGLIKKLFPHIILICFIIQLNAQDNIYSLQLKLNDTVSLQTLVKIQNQQIHIPFYPDVQKNVSEFKIKNDSVRFSISIYENVCLLKKENNNPYIGKWIKYSTQNKTYQLPCKIDKIKAFPKVNNNLINRFPEKWKIKIQSDNKIYYAFGTFKKHTYSGFPFLSGSIATPYGDLGHLTGFISNDTLYLSVFNGSFATQIISKIYYSNSIDSITGYIYYGNWGIEKISAYPDNQFQIQNEVPISDIFGNNNFTLQHQWKDIDDNIVILESNKPVILLLMGSWCPNCTDENKLFSEWYSSFKDKVQIIALAVERTYDKNKAIQILKKYKSKLQIPYPIILLSEKGNNLPFDIFPEIQKIFAFPTTIFFDKQHRPYIATIGFNGPATNELFYQNQEHIKNIIQKIIE